MVIWQTGNNAYMEKGLESDEEIFGIIEKICTEDCTETKNVVQSKKIK